MTRRPIKICYVASIDLTLRFLLLSPLKYLQSRGYEVWGVSAKGRWTSYLEQQGIRIKTVSFTRKIFSPFADVYALISLTFFFKKERFDIVHTHTLKASFLGQLAAFLAGVPIRIYTIHGLDFENNDIPVYKRTLYTFVDRIIAPLVDLALSVNREDIQTAIDKGIYRVGKIKYFGGCVNLQRFNPDRFSQEFIAEKKREIGIPEGVKVIGIVARLVREKGYFELFEAFQKVLLQFPNSVLLSVGPEEPEKEDGFIPEVVKKYGIENHVIFLGERVDVEELYAVMDVFVLPTWREGLGISLLEAEAMEKPVVSSLIRGCREAAENGKTAILVPPKNPEKLAQAILYLFSNPEVARKMGEEGRKKIEREFNEKIVFERLRTEYDRLLKGYKP